MIGRFCSPFSLNGAQYLICFGQIGFYAPRLKRHPNGTAGVQDRNMCLSIRIPHNSCEFDLTAGDWKSYVLVATIL